MRPTAVLRTARLLLEPPVSEDVGAVLAINGDPHVVRHNPSDLVGGPVQARSVLDRWLAHWEQHGFGYWCVRENGHDEVVGFCGVSVVRRPEGAALNLLYRLAPNAWGRGLATEAATAVVGWAREHQPGTRVVARVRPAHLASQRVAVRAGLARAPELDDRGEDGPDLVFVGP